jgi:hypothetical protein
MEFNTGNIIALVVGIVGLIGFHLNQQRAWAALMDSMRKEFVTALDALRRESELRVDKLGESESKARHDLSNHIQGIVGGLGRRVEDMDKVTVRKEDQTALEARLNTSLGEIKTKIDRHNEQLGDIRLLNQRVEGLTALVEKIATKVEAK